MDKPTFQPIGNRILVKQADEALKSGLIIIPEAYKEKPLEGIVIRLGTGNRDKDGMILPFEVGEGDKVIFGKYAGTEIKIDGEEFYLIHADDIHAILE